MKILCHYLNVLHIYCRLRSFLPKNQAMTIAKVWERSLFYRSLYFLSELEWQKGWRLLSLIWCSPISIFNRYR
jgi:hypothetical protein